MSIGTKVVKKFFLNFLKFDRITIGHLEDYKLTISAIDQSMNRFTKLAESPGDVR